MIELERISNAAPAAPRKSTAAGAGGGFWWLIVGILIGLLGTVAWQNRDRDFRGDDGQHHETPIVEGRGIAFVHEHNPLSIEHDLILREMPAWCERRGLPAGFRSYDDDLTDEPVPMLIAFAATRGVNPPFAVLVGKDGKPASAISFPASLQELEGLFK